MAQSAADCASLVSRDIAGTRTWRAFLLDVLARQLPMIRVVSSGQASRSPDLMARVDLLAEFGERFSSDQQRIKIGSKIGDTSHSRVLNLLVFDMLTAFGRGGSAKLSVTGKAGGPR